MTHPIKGEWRFVHGRAYDTAFFLAPFWASLVYFGLLFVFPSHQALIFILSYLLLAETHFASTWMVYLDPTNREHYRTRKWVYYYGPLLLIAGCVGLAYSVSLQWVIFLASTLSAVHVTRQSTGFVALYRGKTAGIHPKQRFWEELALYGFSGGFLLTGFCRFYLDPAGPFSSVLGGAQFLRPVLATGSWVAFALGAGSLVVAISIERGRLRAGYLLPYSKWVVLLYSLFLYSPYLWVSRAEHAIAAGVGIHYVQYLGLVWLLNRNKYASIRTSNWGLNLLKTLSGNLVARIPFLLLYAWIMTTLRQQGFSWNEFAQSSWLYSIPIALQVVHYHVDAFLWKFRSPFVRNTVAPYLRRPQKAT